jgi:hypothetical protein
MEWAFKGHGHVKFYGIIPALARRDSENPGETCQDNQAQGRNPFSGNQGIPYRHR